MDELEMLVTFAAIAVLLVVVLIPYLLFSHWGLKAKVGRLELLVGQLQAALKVPDQTALTPEKAVKAVPAALEPTQMQPEEDAKHAPSPEFWLQGTLEEEPAPPTAYVFKPDLVAKLTAWLRDNWVLAIAAASLALAGVFMVQYGIENGLLTPFWRVMGALAFGAALIAGGEYVRRNAGNAFEDGDAVGETQFLPSTLSGAGIVVLYAAVFAARALYGLIDPLTSFAALGAVSAIALVLGWFYGPVLAAVGILGAALAPFVTGSSSDNSWMVHYYLAMVAAVALGIDTVKRWAWVSVLGLVATLAGACLLWAERGANLHFLGGGLLTLIAAFAIPERGLFPRQTGASFIDALRTRGKLRPNFPTRITFGTTLAVTLAALAVVMRNDYPSSPDTVWLAIFTLGLIISATTLWTQNAPALYDHALIPGLAFLALIALESVTDGPLFHAFQQAAIPAMVGEATPIAASIPITVWVLSGLGALGSLLMFIRMQRAVHAQDESSASSFLAFCAAVFAPATVLMLEFLWAPGPIVGQYEWALAAIAMAAFMVVLTLRSNAADAGAPLRMGLFAVGALTLITLAVFLVLTQSALTVALAVMVLGTALLDRRHAMPPLTYFIQIAVAIITFRLVVWPGFDWALGWDYAANLYEIAYFEVAFAFLATLGLLSAAWWVSRGQRLKTAVVLESACWTILGVFLAVSLLRVAPRDAGDSHWVMGLMSTIWVALALNQLYRMQMGGKVMTVLRAVVAGAYGLAAAGTLYMLAFVSNPIFSKNAPVQGPPVFDSLALAFLPLAATFAIAAWKITHFGRTLRIGFTLAASAFAACYVGLEIRRFWRGTDLSVPGFSDPELYSYTLAMLIASVVLLVLAFGQRSDILRKVAMAGVALTVAKVFLVDMSGLSGLIRVFSFMGLGLSLVGLAWLNRKMTAQWERTAPRN
ncbi:DUF2339 domain-containing protein [Pseudorhodobacter sp. W20_MBD10_FR17]|uniref:DUF2339 domain-containing protein n=1 Tax=Pseudorhodobacter sp. W20_MBD10_FR17 TaxID=3240266 RepID=UPI003F9B760E